MSGLPRGGVKEGVLGDSDEVWGKQRRKVEEKGILLVGKGLATPGCHLSVKPLTGKCHMETVGIKAEEMCWEGDLAEWVNDASKAMWRVSR